MISILIIAALILVVIMAIMAFFVMRPQNQMGSLHTLMRTSSSMSINTGSFGRTMAGTTPSLADTQRAQEEEFRRLKALSSKISTTKAAPTLEEKFFHAGMFTADDRREFQRLRIVSPIVLASAGVFVGFYLGDSTWLLVFVVLGLLVGLQIPMTWIDRRIAQRNEDIMFYLPLVIEQIVIGVSSSLDIGPCLQRVVQMADERDSHNSVTELVRHAQLFVKSGASREEALTEVGKLSGHTELKHAFMSLAQVSKHGGEITRQLQELADSVGSQRETKIDAKIKKLELVATGPVGLVFLGFLVILFTGFGAHLMNAFK